MHEHRRDQNVRLPLQAIHLKTHILCLDLHFLDTVLASIATLSTSSPLATSLYSIAVMNDLDKSCSIRSPTSMSLIIPSCIVLLTEDIRHLLQRNDCLVRSH